MQNSYIVRGFRPQDPGEIERINLMYYHPEVAKAKGYHTKNFGLRSGESLHQAYEPLDDSRLLKRRQASISFAVADCKNRLVGWVWFYHDTRHPLPKMIQRKLGVSEHNSLIYQVSYEKLLSAGWPKRLLSALVYTPASELTKERKGVIVSGLSMSIERLSRRYRRRYLRKTNLVLYAYVLPDNIASQKVLVANEFFKVERLYKYEKVLHQVWVRIV